MSATREQIYAALQAADKAGNTDDAKALAQQYANTPATTAPAAKPATLLSTAVRAGYNAPMDLAETLKGAMQQFGPDGLVAQTAMHPVKAFDAAKDWTSHAADILGGAAQHVRDMSSPDAQGDAPRMDTSAFDNMLATVKQKYGTKQGIYKTIGDHPVGTALAAASIVDPALRVTGVEGGLPAAAGKVAGAFNGAPAVSGITDAASNLIKPVGKLVTAGRRANAASDTMLTDATAKISALQSGAEADASATADRATRAAALADRARAQAKALNDRSTAATAESAPPTPDIGTSSHLSDIGDTLRTPALVQQDSISADMRAADDKYRTAMQQVADDRATAGVGVSDSPIAKAMIRQSQSVVNPNPVTRPSVGSVPADSAGGKLHKMMLDVLQPQNVPLTDVEAIKAAKAGVDVQTGADGGKYRVIKPDLKSVDDFRRYVGKVLNGSVDGYEGLNADEARNMYGNLSKVIDKYVQGASAPVQANWRAGKQALAPFDNVRAGQAIVGTQPGTGGVSTVPAAALPGRIISGGRDTLNQASAVAGPAPVALALRSQVQNALTGKSADAAEAMVRPGTKLGDAMNTDDDLSAAVRDHIAQVRQAEQQGQNATDLARRSATATGRSASLDKVASALQTQSETAALKARQYRQELSTLSVTDPSQVGAKYTDVLNRAHADGTISTSQLNAGLELASTARKAFALKATRDKWVTQALITAGVSGLTAGGVNLVHGAGQ